MDPKKQALLFFCAVCLFLLLTLARAAPQSYRITATELDRLETIWTESQAVKQTWLYQVQKLKTEAQALRADSVTLNSQLLTERQKTQDLKISFETLERARLTELSTLQTEKTDITIKYEKTRRLRDVYGIILLVEIIAIIGAIVWKFRRLFTL